MVSCHFIDYWHSWPCKLNLLVYSWWFHPFWFLFLCWIFHRFGLGCFLHHFSPGILSASLWSEDTFLIAVVWGCFLACFGLGECFLGLTPAYHHDLCCTTLSALGCRPLCSTEQGVLIVPSAHTASKQKCVCSVIGPLLWDWFPLALRFFPRVRFYARLKSPFSALLVQERNG